MSSRYGAARLAVQREQFERLDERLPLARIVLPRLATTRLEPHHLDELVEALAVEPAIGAVPRWDHA